MTDDTKTTKEKSKLVERTETGGKNRLSDEDRKALATIEGLTGNLAKNADLLYNTTAKFLERFRAKKIPKSKIDTMTNQLGRLAAVFGEDHPSIVDLRKDLSASELAANEVGDIFMLEKNLKKVNDLLGEYIPMDAEIEPDETVEELKE